MEGTEKIHNEETKRTETNGGKMLRLTFVSSFLRCVSSSLSPQSQGRETTLFRLRSNARLLQRVVRRQGEERSVWFSAHD